MKKLGDVARNLEDDMRRFAANREAEVTERMRGRTIKRFLVEEHGEELARLFPKNFTLEDYLRTVNDGVAATAKRRLTLCATCPPYGGACSSEYEQLRGRAPCFTEERGLHMDWCNRWRGYLVREKLQIVGVGDLMLGARFENYEPVTAKQQDALAQCIGYAKAFNRKTTRSNLILTGRHFGVGKTHLAISVVAELLATHRLRTAYFAYVPEFFERIRRSYDDPSERNRLDRACTTDLLVLDDLAAQRTTDWVREQMNLISNARWSNGRPTIITTNAKDDLQELVNTLGERTTSRFCGDHYGVDVDGTDRRQVP